MQVPVDALDGHGLTGQLAEALLDDLDVRRSPGTSAAAEASRRNAVSTGKSDRDVPSSLRQRRMDRRHRLTQPVGLAGEVTTDLAGIGP